MSETKDQEIFYLKNKVKKLINSLVELKHEKVLLEAWALKAITVVEFAAGEGFTLKYPYYDSDELLLEGVKLLGVETSEEVRRILEDEEETNK